MLMQLDLIKSFLHNQMVAFINAACVTAWHLDCTKTGTNSKFKQTNKN